MSKEHEPESVPKHVLAMQPGVMEEWTRAGIVPTIHSIGVNLPSYSSGTLSQVHLIHFPPEDIKPGYTVTHEMSVAYYYQGDMLVGATFGIRIEETVKNQIETRIKEAAQNVFGTPSMNN